MIKSDVNVIDPIEFHCVGSVVKAIHSHPLPFPALPQYSRQLLSDALSIFWNFIFILWTWWLLYISKEWHFWVWPKSFKIYIWQCANYYRNSLMCSSESERPSTPNGLQWYLKVRTVSYGSPSERALFTFPRKHTHTHLMTMTMYFDEYTNDEVENFEKILLEQRIQNYFHALKNHKSCNLLSFSGGMLEGWVFVLYLSYHSSSASSFSS